ncbi:uncharacterized protein LOC133907053 [Phragmites australis]|uniref:uncharacterized protein LOC133907053 n=1 Tax=Phragmites australis TaxID=29695 RepID=UPI002D79E3CE|nr:uncharacterized protein LOC133907053 [Phragmites australis]
MGNSSSRSRSNRKSEVTSSSPALKTFKWTIDGFSSLLDKGEGETQSRVFEIMGYNWCLKLNPRDRKSDDDDQEYVSLRLELLGTSVSDVKPDTIVEASFKFLIYDRLYGKHVEHQVSHNFQTASTSSGISYMIPLTSPKEPSSGSVDSISCVVFGVEFTKVVTYKANTVSETLFVQKMNTLNEATTYTWDIEDFFALKSPGFSPEFEAGGYKWSIRIYPSGLDNYGNHISLFLDMKAPNEFPEKDGILVEFTLSVKDQETGKHWKGTGRSQFSKTACVYGWIKFMTLEDFKDSSNGYLVKTKCCIEAEVTIVGSSKME